MPACRNRLQSAAIQRRTLLRKGRKNCVDILAKVSGAGSYTVMLNFSELGNCTESKVRSIIVNSTGPILRLRPVDPEKPINYRYSYRYVQGVINPPKVDSLFVYRLPFSTSADREARFLYNISNRIFGSDNTVRWKSFQFITNPADTVFAARKGVVVSVEDKHDPLAGVGRVSMNSDNNRVVVEHADGTFARYGVLQQGSIMVREGDTVYPDTPMALAGSLDGEVYQIRFDVYYKVDNRSDNPKWADYLTSDVFIDPVFATAAGNTRLAEYRIYTPEVSEELVIREMTKKEIKRVKQE